LFVIGKVDLLLQEYWAFNFESIIGFSKFNEYSITHHSTATEGSILTQIDTSLLLDERITPKGDNYTKVIFVEWVA
jgi:hypothetical protein